MTARRRRRGDGGAGWIHTLVRVLLALVMGGCDAVGAAIPDGSPAMAPAAPALPEPSPARASAARAADTVVIVGAGYAAGAVHRTLLGSEYRDVWTAPVRVPVLDLDEFAGGLAAVRPGGGEQTRSGRFAGADGREYNFRSLDKDAARGLAPILRGGFAEWAMQDQTSSLHPGAAAVASALLEAAGLMHPGPRLVILPSDPRLGVLSELAGTVGWIEHHPDENRDRPEASFAGAVRVIGTDRLLEHLVGEPGRNRVDARAYLRTRLMDVLMGDWDRHAGQLRWAGFDVGEVRRWVPVSEDRDYAFVSYDGVLLRAARFLFAPRARPFEPEIPTNLLPLVSNGAELDRLLIGDVPRAVWLAEADSIRSMLTDEVIVGAVAAMPAAWADIGGDRLAAALRGRRDDLREAAGRFHELLRWQARPIRPD